MSLIKLVSLTLFSSLASTAVVLPALIPLDIALRPPQPPSNPSLPNNITNTASPPSNALRVRCTSTYGDNVNPSSCRNALTQFGPADEEMTFAQRNTGRPDAIPLPLRFVSDDGLCFVQPLLKAESETGRATLKQIGDTAYTLFQECVVGKALGGYAEGIGVSSFSQSGFSRSVCFCQENNRSEPDSTSVTRWRQQSPSCHRGLRTPGPLRQTSRERSTLGLLPHDSLRHAGDGGSEGVWR